MKDFLVTFGEVGIVFILTLVVAAELGRRQNLVSRLFILAASVPTTLIAFLVLQHPSSSNGQQALASKTIDGVEYTFFQVWGDPFEYYQRLAVRERGGKWHVYHFKNKQPYWLGAAIRNASTNKIEITRWGIPIAVFEADAKVLVRVRDKARMEEPVYVGWELR
jgi:hypothetical protein